MSRDNRRWPLLIIGMSAGTAVWSGWVGLGGMTGFGLVHPLPGIADSVTLNTAITLPIGVEAYAVYALAVATSQGAISARARRYAWVSAFAALVLGMFGQIGYHLMASWKIVHAPWQITACVSCLPVAVLGAASLLWHLSHAPAEVTPAEVKVTHVDAPAEVEPAPVEHLESVTRPLRISAARVTPQREARVTALVPNGRASAARALRLEHPELSAAAIAEQLDVTRQTVTRWLRGA